MSMESVALDMSYRAVRRRLMNPPNGKVSEHTEVVSEPELRRQRVDASIERTRMERRAKLEAQMARIEELKLAYAAALAQRFAVARNADLLSPEVEPLPPRPPFIQAIVAEVCRRYNVTPVDVRSKRRTANVVLPRQIIMYIARTITELSLPEIGRRLGNKDHTTVLHSVNKMTYLVENNPHLSAEIADIIATIQARQAQRAGA